MPDYELLFPSDYVKACDLKGRDATVTITAINLDDLPLRGTSQTRTRGVVSFKETDKKLVLNRTNGDTLASLYGRNTDEWIGKRVTLCPTNREIDGPNKGKPIRYGREVVEAIRVRPTKPAPKGQRSQQQPPPQPVDEPPPDGPTDADPPEPEPGWDG